MIDKGQWWEFGQDTGVTPYSLRDVSSEEASCWHAAILPSPSCSLPRVVFMSADLS